MPPRNCGFPSQVVVERVLKYSNLKGASFLDYGSTTSAFSQFRRWAEYCFESTVSEETTQLSSW